jgi:glycerol-3-phosphate dehydrogenase
VQDEMAQVVEDLVQRRTELGPRGMATDAAQQAAAEVLAQTRATAAV